MLSNEYYTKPELIKEVMEYLQVQYKDKNFIWESDLPNGMIFKQGGDYKNYDYSTIPNNTIIVFNPPFEYLREICLFFNNRNIKFVSFMSNNCWTERNFQVLLWYRDFTIHKNYFKNVWYWNTPEGEINKNIGISLITNLEIKKFYKNGKEYLIKFLKRNGVIDLYSEDDKYLGKENHYENGEIEIIWKRSERNNNRRNINGYEKYMKAQELNNIKRNGKKYKRKWRLYKCQENN